MNPIIICVTILVTVAAVESSIDWSKVYPRSALNDEGQLKENAKPMNQVRRGRLFGGQRIITNSEKYLAALFPNYSGTKTFCQGSIISARAVLTRANCVSGSEKTDVIVGAHDLDNPGIYTKTMVVYRGSYRIPTEYNKGISYDVAVLSLPTDLTFNRDVQRIALPPADLLYPGEQATVISWGSSRTPLSTKNAILQVDICKEHFNSEFTDDHLCFSTVGGQGPCVNDGGAPLVHTAFNGQISLIGQFEFIKLGTACNAEYPAAFTKIISHVQFIKDNM